MKQSKVLSKKEKKETERKMWLKFQSTIIKFPDRIGWSEEVTNSEIDHRIC